MEFFTLLEFRGADELLDGRTAVQMLELYKECKGMHGKSKNAGEGMHGSKPAWRVYREFAKVSRVYSPL
jgi:hypothetical protein